MQPLSPSLLFILFWLFTGTAAQANITPESAAAAQYGKLPLSFEANQGQTDPSVRFLSRGPGYALFITPTEAVFSLRKGGAKSGGEADSTGGNAAPGAMGLHRSHALRHCH